MNHQLDIVPITCLHKFYCVTLASQKCCRKINLYQHSEFWLMFGVKQTIASYCFTLLLKMQLNPLFLVLFFVIYMRYDVSCAVLHGS